MDSGGFGYSTGTLASLSRPPTFANPLDAREYIKRKMCSAMRVLASKDLDRGNGAQISVRDPIEGETFWFGPWGVAFALMQPDQLIRVDAEGNYIEGGRPGHQSINRAGFAPHSAIHSSRPSITAIVHAHSTSGSAFSTLRIPLPIRTQDSCVFWKSQGLHLNYRTTKLRASEEGSIANSLGEHKAVILVGHGNLTVGETIESALVWFLMLEKECHSALKATDSLEIDDVEAEFTHRATAHEPGGYFKGCTYIDVVERDQGHEYL